MDLKIQSASKTSALTQTQPKKQMQQIKPHNPIKQDRFEKEKQKKPETLFNKISNKLKPYKDKIVIGLALFGGLIIGLGRGNSKRRELQNESDRLRTNVSTLEADKKDLQDTVRDLEAAKQNLQNAINALQTPDTFNGTIDRMRSTIASNTLDYDPASSPLGKKANTFKNTGTQIPDKHIPTTNRSSYTPYTPPEYIENTNYNVHIPDSNEERITHQSSDFKETKMQTTIIEDYADSVQWENDKIARDIMQNFYDGHGQTLNGVDMSFVKQPNGKFKVRIAGKSTYSPDKAVLLGESTKRNDSKAAGNYGEGLKMVVLKLLKDEKSDSVRIASDNWKLDWKLEEGTLSKKRVLSYSLEKSEPYNGNYIEFETENTKLLKSLVNSINYFYYAGNESFINPDFENEQFGIKLMPKGKKGGIYIAGQQFEFDGKYNNIPDLTIFIKEKPPVTYNGSIIFDPSRDRISLTQDNIHSIANWLAQDCRTTEDEMAKVLKALEPHWDYKYSVDKTPPTTFLEGIIYGLTLRGGMKFKFPSNCLSRNFRARSFDEIYKRAGYRICAEGFSNIGMKDLLDVVKNDKKHVPVQPTSAELKKIKILREGVSLLSPLIRDIGFTNDEMRPKIYLFNNNENGNQNNAYSNVEGEAIIEYGYSKGFWLDRKQLNTKDFIGLLTISLHEITHKFGGDDSAEFSYRLTDVMEGVLKVAQKRPDIAEKLKALEQLWNE